VTRYDRIGLTYTATRQPDPRIEAAVWAALGDARSVANVGAGAGSYEPRDRSVIAIEPSQAMIEKRPDGAAPVIQGSAEALPLDSDSVDAAMAVFTIHHWQDIRRGLAELRRVARRRIVILTWDKSFTGSFWLTRDYLPELDDWTVGQLPSIDDLETELGSLERRSLPVPRDCRDGFLRAYWGRPEAYLEQHVRKNISQFNLVDGVAVERGIDRLARDLSSGGWDRRNGHLRTLDSLDLGYVLLIATRCASEERTEASGQLW
jgi:SAM-dependent methyltransferase